MQTQNKPGAQTHKPDIVLIAGATGTGKSAQLKREIKKTGRLVVWDTCDEYAAENCERVTTLAALKARMIKRRRGSLRIAFVPSDLRAFDQFCLLVHAWSAPPGAPCMVVVEELADVTSPGKAPPGWGVLLRRGRHVGLKIRAITQRPAESDKTVIGNATRWRCYAMGRYQDRAYMAREMGINQSILDELEKLQYIDVSPEQHPRRPLPGRVKF